MPRLPFGGQAGVGGTPASAAVFERIDEHEAVGTESSYVITPTVPITGALYNEIIVMINYVPTAIFNLEAHINAVTSSDYFGDGYRIKAGVETLIDEGGLAHWIISSSAMVLGANISGCVLFRIMIPDADAFRAIVYGFSDVTAETIAVEHKGFTLNGIAIASITDITIATSTSTWKAGTKITTYGVRRVDP